MDAIPLCDIIKTYTDIYVNTQQILFNTILFYFARGDMFRLLIQPSSGRLTIEQYLLCAHNMGSHIVRTQKVLFYCKLAWRWLYEQPKHVATRKIK